jgi:hypothetical protein
MLNELTASVLTVDLLRTKLANDSHSECSLNHVHLAGLILFPVSLTCLHLSAKVRLDRAKVASTSVAVGHVAILSRACYDSKSLHFKQLELIVHLPG